MINISNPSKEPVKTGPSITAFFDFAFRPFFLLGALFSVIALVLWSLMLQGNVSLSVFGGSFWWHQHEMLFGFTTAIIVGFLLTAVQNWSGVRGLNGKGLMALVGVWVLGRIVFLFPDVLPHWLISSVDFMFLPLAIIALAYPIIKVKLWRNLLFIPLLSVMAIVNGVMHYAVLFERMDLVLNASSIMVMLVTLLMCIMGGRVFPMFTANGTKTARVDALPWLEKLSIFSTLFAVILSTNVLPVPNEWIAVVFFVAAIANAVRAIRWRIWVTLKTPLVWSLHLSYWSIAIGLCMYGMYLFNGFFSHSQAVHTLTIGGMATMILSMISRVSLGHTGRNIVVGKVMASAFVAILGAFLVRVFGLYFFADYTDVINTSILLWVVGYGSFVAMYLPILTTPRHR